MKPIVKKITIISITLAVVIGCFCIPASAAQWIVNDVAETTYNNALLAPTLVRYFSSEFNDEGESIATYGTVFAVQPVFNISRDGYAVSFINTTAPSTVPEPYSTAFRTIGMRVQTYEHQRQMVVSCWLHNLTASGYNRQIQQTQLGFPTFTCTYNGSHAWHLSMPLNEIPSGIPNGQQPFGIACSYYTFDSRGMLEKVDIPADYIYAYNTSTDTVLRLKDILDYIAEYGDSIGKPLAYDSEGRTTIENMTIYAPQSARGYFQISTHESYFPQIHYVASGTVNNIVSYEDFNLLTWIGESLSAIFGATLFEIGDTTVTIGGALAVPLSLMFFIAFLRKFAGG